MIQQGFDIVVTAHTVEVRHDVSSASPRGRFYAGLSFFAIIVVAICAVVFLPGKHGRPSMWRDMSTAPLDSSDFIVPLSIVVVCAVVMGWLTLRWLLAAYPSDESLHCDGATLTVSRIPWLDGTNSKWVSEAYPLREVSRVNFGVIASAKNSSVCGIRFRAAGKKRKVLYGIEAPEAAEILKALAALGADVVDDPKLSGKVRKAMSNR